ncbi:MAG: hypothetical protein R6T96_07320 [Longimicrobiales bacterium]
MPVGVATSTSLAPPPSLAAPAPTAVPALPAPTAVPSALSDPAAVPGPLESGWWGAPRAAVSGPVASGWGAPLPDTLEGIRRATRLLRNRYRGIDRLSSARGRPRSQNQDPYCYGGEGSVCHGGDPDRGICNAGVSCHPTEEFLLEGLREEALRYPESGFLMGQAVYALTKFGGIEAAQEVVDACEADGWWCQALQGYVLYTHAPLVEVEARFRSALEQAPEEIRCSWKDATWLLGEWDQRVGGMENLPEVWRSTSDWDCRRRMAVSDTLFWLGNPFYSREGNDRWTTHIARAMAAHLYEELRRTVRGSPLPEEEQARDWAMRIRRGPWDSYQFFGGGRSVSLWTSQEAARYHFIPEISLDDLSDPEWRIQGDILKEGYTPEYGPLFVIPGQVARFRDGEALKVAAAAGVEGSRLHRALDFAAHLVLTREPGSISLQKEESFRQERPVVMGSAPHESYVLSLEVSTNLGMGLHRELITSLAMDEPEISDLVLYEVRENSAARGSAGGGSMGPGPQRSGAQRSEFEGGGPGPLRGKPRSREELHSREGPRSIEEPRSREEPRAREEPRSREKPRSREEPRSLEEIGTRMLGSTNLGTAREVGVFWEVYGIPAEEEIAFDLTLERATGGLVERLRGFFPGGEREGRGQVTWTEPSLGLAHPRGITLNLSGLQPGDYTLVIRARRGSAVNLERQKELRIE